MVQDSQVEIKEDFYMNTNVYIDIYLYMYI